MEIGEVRKIAKESELFLGVGAVLNLGCSLKGQNAMAYRYFGVHALGANEQETNHHCLNCRIGRS